MAFFVVPPGRAQRKCLFGNWHDIGTLPARKTCLAGTIRRLPPTNPCSREQTSGHRLKHRGMRSDRRGAHVSRRPPSPHCGPRARRGRRACSHPRIRHVRPGGAVELGGAADSGGHTGGRARHLAGDVPRGGTPDPVGPRSCDRGDREAAGASRARSAASRPGRDRLVDRQRSRGRGRRRVGDRRAKPGRRPRRLRRRRNRDGDGGTGALPVRPRSRRPRHDDARRRAAHAGREGDVHATAARRSPSGSSRSRTRPARS